MPPRPTLNRPWAPHPSEPAKTLQKILLSHFITEPERVPNQYNRMKSPNKSTEELRFTDKPPGGAAEVLHCTQAAHPQGHGCQTPRDQDMGQAIAP